MTQLPHDVRAATLDRQLKLVAELLAQGQAVGEAAKAAKISTRSLSRKFAEHFGCTPREYQAEHCRGRRLVVHAYLRLTTEELTALKAAAKRAGLTKNAYIFRLVRRSLRVRENVAEKL